MKVLQINGYESPGRRFHGLSIAPQLKAYGIDSSHLVWEKDTHNPDVLTFEGRHTRRVNRVLNRVERAMSLQSVLYPHALSIMNMPAFQAADLVHLHIIHSGYFSLRHLPKLTDAKPTVWTLHDPWAMTGHCIHPFDCDRWRIGCGHCPDLNTPFPLFRDNTRFLFNYKRKAYQKAQFELIVASKWMHNMAKASPLFEGVRIHEVPFGLDLDFFAPGISSEARKRFQIAEDALVIAFRTDPGKFKGFSFILEALKQIHTTRPVCLLTLGYEGLLTQVQEKFQVVEIGWSNDESLVRDAFNATDIFLMPSMAEAFGMMAVEAMACAKPIIVFEGTALPDITFAPEAGIAVPKGDATALAAAIQRLMDNPQEREMRGHQGRKLAEAHYGQDMHVKRMVDIYRNIVGKK